MRSHSLREHFSLGERPPDCIPCADSNTRESYGNDFHRLHFFSRADVRHESMRRSGTTVHDAILSAFFWTVADSLGMDTVKIKPPPEGEPEVLLFAPVRRPP